MKTLFHNTVDKSEYFNRFHSFDNTNSNSNNFINYSSKHSSLLNRTTSFSRQNLLKPEANLQMLNGEIPDLWDVCRDLFNTFFINQAPYSAKQFTSVLQVVQTIDQEQVKIFLKNRETRHVLIDNDLLKVVLIHWKPGKVSSIHGHPGGCMFKILQGKLEELRYSNDSLQRIIESNGYRAGDMAYIDNSLGYHSVGNIFGSPAISLHAYTPGK